MKPMLPTYYPEAPNSKDWRYEVKYDGFRAILTIDFDTISISSRNERNYHHNSRKSLLTSKIWTWKIISRFS